MGSGPGCGGEWAVGGKWGHFGTVFGMGVFRALWGVQACGFCKWCVFGILEVGKRVLFRKGAAKWRSGMGVGKNGHFWCAGGLK